MTYFRAILTLALALALGWTTQARGADLPVKPAVARIDAVHGRRMVVPVEIPDERVLRKGVTLRTDDGTELPATFVWLTAAPDPDLKPDWLGPALRWHALPVSRVPRERERPRGGWRMILDPPMGVIGQGLWIENTRFEVNWLPDPWRLGLGQGQGGGHPDGMWASPAPTEALDSPAVARAIRRLGADPTNRRRARLLADGLAPGSALVRSADEKGLVRLFAALRAELANDDEEADALDAIAEQLEARWQVALATLWLYDPDLCRSVRTTAAGVAKFGDAWAPAWDPSPLVVDDLLEDLLSPYVDDETRALRARAWLATQPRAVVWVFDDAGRQDGVSGDLLPTIGVVSTPRSDVPALVGVEGAGGPQLEPVPPRELRVIGAAVDAEHRPSSAPSLEGARVTVRVGRWTTDVRVDDAIVDARPPGVSIGPLLEDWTMPAWWSSRDADGALPPATARTGAVLSRRARPTGGETRSGWTVLVECASAPKATNTDASELASNDAVRVWIGPYGRPSAVLRIDSTGAVTDELASRRGAVGFGGRTLDVARSKGRWAFELTLPPDAVGEDGVLRIGLDRTDADGRHTGWPRRMLPWQDEPGRAAVDTRAWDGLTP
ncbi:MAG: hypothetical protein R3B49_04315 [Phycisphaerales bacterium]